MELAKLQRSHSLFRPRILSHLIYGPTLKYNKTFPLRVSENLVQSPLGFKSCRLTLGTLNLASFSIFLDAFRCYTSVPFCSSPVNWFSLNPYSTGVWQCCYWLQFSLTPFHGQMYSSSGKKTTGKCFELGICFWCPAWTFCTMPGRVMRNSGRSKSHNFVRCNFMK